MYKSETTRSKPAPRPVRAECCEDTGCESGARNNYFPGKRLTPDAIRLEQRYLNERIAVLDDPRQLGLALQGKSYKGLWRYRVGDYRILAEIKDDVLTILVIEIGHRRDIYK